MWKPYNYQLSASSASATERPSRSSCRTAKRTLSFGLILGLAGGCLSTKNQGGLEDPEVVPSDSPDASITNDDPPPVTDAPLVPEPTIVADSGMPIDGEDPVTTQSCVFYVAAPLDAEESAPLDAGVELGTSVMVSSNAFLGEILTDDMGRSLYIYGADLPGDCETAPVSNCAGDCLLSWPIFDAGARTLPEGFSDEGFGYIDRADGPRQTTYFGWPLYYFRDDLAPTDVNGHGRGGVWFAAEAQLPNLVVMRAPAEAGGVKYLGSETGRTLYAFSADTLGTDMATPVSACTEACLDTYAPFMPRTVRAVSTLNPASFEVFVRGDGLGTQVAYNGSPLYTAVDDIKSGDWNGVETGAWDIVVP